MPMKTGFKPVAPRELPDNPFGLIGDQWMLITAGNLAGHNCMTASWGGLGILWGKQVAFCFVRPTRHTFGFMEAAGLYTLSFFPGSMRAALDLCGSKSGRDIDKDKAAGLSPFEVEPGAVSYEQARLVLVCRKLYRQDIDPARFVDTGLEVHYPKKDYHRMYIGEVVTALHRA
jgi:flavin reductase (DIM6/NTAB) family NADH-FMN oxidoreductase RutF